MTKPDQEPREGHVAVGRVLRPWGLGGHVKVESLTDFPERFRRGARLWLDGRERTIEHARSQSGYLYVKLSGVDDVDEAEPYRGHLLEVPEAALPPLGDDEFYHHQLIGLRAVTADGIEVGTIVEVLSTGGNAVLVARGPHGEVLLPFIDDVVRAVDLAAGTVTVELIEGLLPEPKAASRRAPRQRRGRRLAPKASVDTDTLTL